MADTRRQILLTIKEQVRLLKEPAIPLSQAEEPRWSQQQWHESFNFLFVSHSDAGRHQHQDDLLFFVKHKTPAATSQQVSVRRRAKQLPDELQLTGRDFSSVDWAQSVLLNLVLHSQYQLTVVACSPEALAFVAEGRTWSPGMISVTRPVYASTTVTAVNLDSSRAKDSTPQPCYPDICFAVDNFDNAFEDLVLEDVGRCYCVVLHAILDAHDTAPDLSDSALNEVTARLSLKPQPGTETGSGTPSSQEQPHSQQQPQQPQQPTEPQPQHASGSGGSTQQPGAAAAGAAGAAAADTDGPVAVPNRHSSTDGSCGSAWQIGTHKRTLFAGYVSFQQIQEFMQGSSSSSRGKGLLDGWLKGPTKEPQKDKVIMTGPGGMGRCEVAVTQLDAPAAAAAAPGKSSGSSSSAGGGHHRSASAPAISAAPAAAAAAPAASPPRPAAAAAGQQQQQAISPRGSPGPQGLGQALLQRGLQRARVVDSGVQQALDVLSELQPGPGPPHHMLCALMTLRLPVAYLAQELLAAV